MDDKRYHIYSQYRRRYIDNKYDLDLSYITKNIIAMSFPETGLVTIVKNSMSNVERFLDDQHPNSYLVVNLTPKKYDINTRFHGNFIQFPFEDHTAPRLYETFQLVARLNNFLTKSSNNVVAIHCKAGKGRTGTIVCALLLYQNSNLTADDAVDFYARQRSYDGSGGVENICQVRFVRTFELMRNQDYCYIKRIQHKEALQQYTLIKIMINNECVQQFSKIQLQYYNIKTGEPENIDFIRSRLVTTFSAQRYNIFNRDFSIEMTLKNKKTIMAQLNTEFLSTVELQRNEGELYIYLRENDIDYAQRNGFQNSELEVVLLLIKVQE